VTAELVFGIGEDVSVGGRCITLPSADAAVRLVRGDVARGLPGVLGTALLRGLLIAGGLYAVGERAHLVRNALGASAVIEAFVLAWVAAKSAQQPSAVTA
jgi:hypothetical protein